MDEQNTYPQWDLFQRVGEVMEVREWGYEGPFLVFRGKLKNSPEEAFRLIKDHARVAGLLPLLQSDQKGEVLKFIPPPRPRRSSRVPVHILLLFLTVLSTLLAGALMEGVQPDDLLSRPSLLCKGIPFSFTLLVILGLHELSHYFMSLKHGIRTSLPYFIPFPNILGTMGAVIVSRSPFPDRKSLFDVGVAGPLASFILSVIAIYIGLQSAALAEVGPGGLLLGDSLLTRALFSIRFPSIPPDCDIVIGPVAFAGWVGLFVTALNLLPMGQLDGGHIAYALFGRRHGLISAVSMGIVLLLGVIYRSPVWIIIVLFIAFLGRHHNPPLNDITPLNPSRVLLAVFSFLILVLCFIPVPIRIL